MIDFAGPPDTSGWQGGEGRTADIRVGYLHAAAAGTRTNHLRQVGIASRRPNHNIAVCLGSIDYTKRF